MDETRVQVHREHKREDSSNSDIWVAIGGDPKRRIVRYLYATSRGACLAHIRKKFVEATKIKKKIGAVHEAVSKIAKIYRPEKELREKELPAEAFLAARRDAIGPLLEDFAAWLNKKSTVAPSSQLGKTITYAKGQWNKLSKFLDHEALTPDNNASLSSRYCYRRPFNLAITVSFSIQIGFWVCCSGVSRVV